MKNIKKVLLAVFFLVWERWIYDMLEELTNKTESPLDDLALQKVDEALEEIKNWGDDVW